MRQQPECPECEKLTSASEESSKIGNFLDWLSENNILLARYEKCNDFKDEMLFPVQKSFEQLLSEYFEIDLNKVEQERRALLDWLREIK